MRSGQSDPDVGEALVYGRGRYARTEEEVRDLVDDIMENLEQRVIDPSDYETLPERAVICILGGERPEETNKGHADNCLYVSINTRAGYGTLRWWTTQVPQDKTEEDIFRSVWTSMNPDPPSPDPLLIKDPGGGECYPPEAAIPVAEVREAVEEFCRARTGKRPRCIKRQLLDQTY